MKAWLILAALAVPAAAAATIAMEPAGAQTTQPEAKAPPHRQLFTVKYVLRPNPAPLPHVVIEQGGGLATPTDPAHQALLLGAGYHDPNAILCYGWGCQSIGHAR